MKFAVGAGICALALLSFFQFPGHTWLQQDTQIYLPILEHLRDPAVLDRDLLVQYPHVSFTLYDEIALGLRRICGVGFEYILEAEQIVCRALGIWGIYLIATSAGLDSFASLFVAAIFSLGASIAGPSVLTFEYEPTPRAMAVPLLFCAIGLTSHKRFLAAGIAAGAGFLLHAPTIVPFLFVLLWISRRQWRTVARAWIALLCAAVVLTIASKLQPGLHDQQEFFTRLTPQMEAVQRLRTAYNWISTWWASLLPQYIALYGLGLLAFSRVKRTLPSELQSFALILPALGMLSMPISYVLLEQLKWSLIPQLQPMRVLLFVTAFAVILGSIAAIRATRQWESVAWFALVFYIPMRVQFFDPPDLRIVTTALLLAVLATLAQRMPRPALLIASALPFLLIPVSNYPKLHTPELADLSSWAREHTPSSSVFLFPDAGHLLYPGIFRAEALRAVYVDWKSGGQVNYLKDFADQWIKRWASVSTFRTDYRGFGIDYVVLRRGHSLKGTPIVFENSQYAIYRIANQE